MPGLAEAIVSSTVRLRLPARIRVRGISTKPRSWNTSAPSVTDCPHDLAAATATLARWLEGWSSQFDRKERCFRRPWPGPVATIGTRRIHEGESVMSQSRLPGLSDNGGGTCQILKLPTSGLRSAGARRSMLGFRTCRRRLGHGRGKGGGPGEKGGE